MHGDKTGRRPLQLSGLSCCGLISHVIRCGGRGWWWRATVDQWNHYCNHSSDDLMTASCKELITTASHDSADHVLVFLFFLFFFLRRPSIETPGTTAPWRTASSSLHLRPARRPKTTKTASSSSHIAAWWRRPSCTATWGGPTSSLRWWPPTTTAEDTAAKQK